MSDLDIVSRNLEEWAQVFAEKYSVDPISIFETNIEKTCEMIKIRGEVFSPLSRKNPVGEVDGVRVTFKIPFGGEPTLFELRPSTRIELLDCNLYETQNFVSLHGEECGSFTVDFDYTNQELRDMGNAMAECVQRRFKDRFEYIKKMICNVNRDVTALNKGLSAFALRLLKERKSSIETFSAIGASLQIPLAASEKTSMPIPIPPKRSVHQPSVKPAHPSATPEPRIPEEDYERINSIIEKWGTKAEETAKTYVNNGEEQLRDHLINALGLYYECVTGETFRKTGKTDILIGFENKAAFVGECKIWHGEKTCQTAIQQVIGYCTWRDSKISLIIFNKENQSFQKILSAIDNWVNENALPIDRRKENVWRCNYHQKDGNLDFKLTILAFDLFVDRGQLNN